MSIRLHFSTCLFIVLCLLGCKREVVFIQDAEDMERMEPDSILLAEMISIREQAMITKNMPMALSQFGKQATWINSQGYFFEGQDEVEKFHGMLAGNDSLDYWYKAGKPKIRLLDSNNALVYYSWKMFWYQKAQKTDTVIREIGLMTLNAQKQNNQWKWVAVTNQHTPWFYEKIKAVTIE
ncbi:hypothetical protein SAMN04488116_2400 [Flagellimonas flava]|uniref:SnoaL-like domain-containing protein n=2 Tax=Flagellimonas flava TaxID=570519 RepID=A0A1M5MDG7_9FLAO|nr:hypothetical protein SAMN04488116_2400 [Allomuricauda flava]